MSYSHGERACVEREEYEPVYDMPSPAKNVCLCALLSYPQKVTYREDGERLRYR